MKKILFTLLVFAMLVFTACGYNSENKETQENDTIEVVNDSIVKEDIIVNMDTLHCVAITKNGTQCKNHRVAGDTLCAIHRKNK